MWTCGQDPKREVVFKGLSSLLPLSLFVLLINLHFHTKLMRLCIGQLPPSLPPCMPLFAVLPTYIPPSFPPPVPISLSSFVLPSDIPSLRVPAIFFSPEIRPLYLSPLPLPRACHTHNLSNIHIFSLTTHSRCTYPSARVLLQIRLFQKIHDPIDRARFAAMVRHVLVLTPMRS